MGELEEQMRRHLDFKDRVMAARRIPLLLVFLLGLAGTALAQGNRVCLYDQPNYAGESICFNAGETADDFQKLSGGWNDRAQSIRLFGNVQATIYADAGFSGASFVVTSDLPDLAQLRDNELRNWRRQVSSIQVEARNVAGGPVQGGAQDNRVCIYGQPNYGGQSVCFNVGEESSDLRRIGRGWNDRASSIRVFGNVQATIYEDTGFGGASYVVTTDVPDFAQLRGGELRNWRRELSSIRVERMSGRGRPGRTDQPESADRVCLYDQPNYAGQSVCFNAGESSSELRLIGDGWNDRAVSLRVFGNAEATVYEHVAFGGDSALVNSDIQNLAQLRSNVARGNFRQQISSISVERRGGGSNTVSEAYRLGRQDFAEGRQQNYRVHSTRYNRAGEAEFARLYNEGYRGAGANTGGGFGSGGPFRGLNAAYSGLGQLQIGNRTQQVTDVLVRLHPGGVAQFEISGEMPRLSLTGNWLETTRGQIEVTLRQGFGSAIGSGQGRLYFRNDQFQRLELTGQTNRQNFLLAFRDDDGRWGGWTGSSAAARPNGTVVHRGSIINRRSGKGLDVADRSAAEGASIQQWDYSNQPNQTWQVIDLGNGEVVILADHSGKALSVQGGGTFNGANIVQREWRNNPLQRWRLQQVSGGFYRIVNVGSGKCLDVTDQSRENGANLQQWDCANQQHQQFRLNR
jgi:hypothetical protein